MYKTFQAAGMGRKQTKLNFWIGCLSSYVIIILVYALSSKGIFECKNAQVKDGQQQFIYFTGSAIDSAPSFVQATRTGPTSKLVEKYHQHRLDNLQIEHETILRLYKYKLSQAQSKVEADTEKSAFGLAEHEARLRYLFQEEYYPRVKAIEAEYHTKVRAVEQELMFAQQEYEEKMKLLNVQLLNNL